VTNRIVVVVAMLSAAGCSHHDCPVTAPQTEPVKATGGLEYVGGTAIQANDPKTLSAWYNDRFGLPIKGEMPGGAYGGFDWNGTSFNIAIVAAGGEHPGSAPGTAYLVFHVGNYDRFVAARAAKGLTPFETSSEEYGRFAKFRDPEGNEVDVWGQ
jgi:predicted enzyme related to lactoylglutathione lyase